MPGPVQVVIAPLPGPAVDAGYGLPGRFQDGLVPLLMGGGGVLKIAQQQVFHVVVPDQRPQGFQLFRQLPGPLGAGEQGGDHHQGAAVVGQFVQFQAQQRPGLDQPGHRRPRQGHGKAPGQQRQGGQQVPPARPGPQRPQDGQGAQPPAPHEPPARRVRGDGA